MVEIAAIFGIWYAMGAAGSFLTMNYWWRCGRPALDVDVGDIFFFAFMAFTGPFNLVVGVCLFISWLLGGIVNTSRVIFPAKD